VGGAQLGLVAVAFDQQPQHPAVILHDDQSHPIRAQRRHSDRSSVVGIVLLGATRTQHPHPRRQHRGDIDHRLTGSDELLGDQIAQPAGRLHRPRPLSEALRPRTEPLHLDLRRSDLDLVEDLFVVVDGDRGVGRLVGIDADHHAHRCAFRSRVEPRWALLIPGRVLAPLSSHTTAGTPAGRRFENKPARGRQALSEPTDRTLRRYENTAAPTPSINQAPSGGQTRRSRPPADRYKPDANQTRRSSPATIPPAPRDRGVGNRS